MTNIIVALDLPSSGAALGLVDELGDAIAWYKVGSPLFTRSGPNIVRELRSRGKKVFLDLKYHDIPSTVARAVDAAAALDVSMLTLHASGGVRMLNAARAAAAAGGPRLLAVTLLTSFAAADIEQVWSRQVRVVRDEVMRLAALAAEAGLDGVVSSPLEAEALKRSHGPGFLVVTPGIRPDDEPADDQARTATPQEAASTGADYLVVGRPILEAEDRPALVERMLAEVADATQVAP